MLLAGVLALLAACYEIWGTGWVASRAQAAAREELDERLRAVQAEAARTVDSSSEASSVSTPAQPVLDEPGAQHQPSPGEAVAAIRAPSIGLDAVVVHGVGADELRIGPGHFPGSPMPGQAGNAAIAGHRTTYGAPFGDLDRLAPGDEITITSVLGTAVYRVDRPPFVVRPDQVEVLDDFGDDRLTLTTCNPKYSAAERLIVTATLLTAPFEGVAQRGGEPSSSFVLPAEETPVGGELSMS